MCVCVCAFESACVSLCFAVRPSGPGDKSRMSDWGGQRARTITFEWSCGRKRLSFSVIHKVHGPVLTAVGDIEKDIEKFCLLTWHWRLCCLRNIPFLCVCKWICEWSLTWLKRNLQVQRPKEQKRVSEGIKRLCVLHSRICLNIRVLFTVATK